MLRNVLSVVPKQLVITPFFRFVLEPKTEIS